MRVAYLNTLLSAFNAAVTIAAVDRMCPQFCSYIASFTFLSARARYPIFSAAISKRGSINDRFPPGLPSGQIIPVKSLTIS